MTGWVLMVWLSASASPPETSCHRSWQSTSEASSKVARTCGRLAKPSSMPTDCDPWPGNTNAVFILISRRIHTGHGTGRSPAQQNRTPGEAAAHPFHQHRLAGLDAAVPHCDVQGQRNGSRRGVAMPVQCHNHPLHAQAELPGG